MVDKKEESKRNGVVLVGNLVALSQSCGEQRRWKIYDTRRRGGRRKKCGRRKSLAALEEEKEGDVERKGEEEKEVEG